MHVVWLRVDVARGIAIHDGHNYRKHEEVSRELEREFGHRHVRGAHIAREGRERPARTPSHAEMQQAQRTTRTPQEAKREITGLWNEAATGREFASALEQAGWTLAQGDRRDFVLLDGHGEVHSLARRIEAAKAAQVRERMADVDREQLPTVAQAREIVRRRAQVHEREPVREVEPVPVPPSRAVARDNLYEVEDIAARNREQTVIEPESPARGIEPPPPSHVPAEPVRVMETVDAVAQTVFDAATLKPIRRPAWRMFEMFSRFATGAVEHVAELFAGMFDSRPAAPSQPQGSKPAALPLPPPERVQEPPPPPMVVRKAEPKRSLADDLLAEARQQQAKEDLRELLNDYENPHEMEMRRKRGLGMD